MTAPTRPRLIFSMGVSVDGYVAGPDGSFDWTVPTDELFGFHLDRVRELGAHLCGRRLYETMLPWETDAALRVDDLHAAFADVWTALPKVVFSRTLDRVAGNARLATGTVAEEAATALGGGRDVEIGGAELAAQAVALGLVDELRIFRHPVVAGGGSPYLPAVPDAVRLTLLESRVFEPGVVYERYLSARP